MRITMMFIVVSLLVLGAMGLYQGQVPPPGQMVQELANRPEVKAKFSDGTQGRFDASMFLFTVMLAMPILTVFGLLVVGVATIALDGTVMMLGRRLGVPDGVTVTLVVGALAGAAYANTELWLPRSLKFLGLLARAYLVSTT